MKKHTAFKSVLEAFTLITLVVLASACGTTTAGGDGADEKPTIEQLLAQLPALQAVVTADNADRALYIAQEIRVTWREQLAQNVYADRSLSDEELRRVASFHRYDQQFTANWSRARNAVVGWRAANGGAMPRDFAEAYAIILEILTNPNGLRDSQ